MIYIALLFWPLSLFIKNTPSDFLSYVLPIFNAKLSLFPLIFTSTYILLNRKLTKSMMLSLILSFSLLITNFNSFWGQTIFKPDYEAGQAVIRQTLLYPNTFTARLFHNKLRIYIDKFNNNFFALTDLNNYFFKFHPNEIVVDNQNLKKFPSFGIFVLLYGLFKLKKARYKNLILSWLIAGAISLSILTNFDRNDFILWIPLSLILVHGAKQIKNRIFWIIFIIFTTLELWQIIV